MTEDVFLPDRLSPSDRALCEIEDWEAGTRGAKASDEEIKRLVSYLFADEPWGESIGRQFQVAFQWFDKVLPAPGKNRGKVLARDRHQVPVGKLEEILDQLQLTFYFGEESHTALDLWLEGKCLEYVLLKTGGMERRWKELKAVLIERELSKTTFEYLQEAAESYLLGQYKAAIALCRAATESCLKNVVPGVEPRSEPELADLVRMAIGARVLDANPRNKHRRFVKKIREHGNGVLHLKRKATQRGALDILRITGELIEHLQSRDRRGP